MLLTERRGLSLPAQPLTLASKPALSAAESHAVDR